MNILFVCKANVGRSQMASFLFNKLSEKNKSISAGIMVGEKEGEPLHEFVIKCMAEEGLDLSKNKRKQLTPEMVKTADRIIVMAEKENLPDYLANSNKITFWKISDAKNMPYEVHVKVRNEIKTYVKRLVKEIG
jgi:arsenate-mycothiol transferase